MKIPSSLVFAIFAAPGHVQASPENRSGLAAPETLLVENSNASSAVSADGLPLEASEVDDGRRRSREYGRRRSDGRRRFSRRRGDDGDSYRRRRSDDREEQWEEHHRRRHRGEESSPNHRRRMNERKANDMKECWKNTGGTCMFWDCKDWRSHSDSDRIECWEGECICKKDYCSSVEGSCSKDTGKKIKEGVRIRNVYDDSYVLFADGCGKPSQNSGSSLPEEGLLKVREDYDGPESLFDIWQMPANYYKNGKKGYFLVSQDTPSCAVTLGDVQTCNMVEDEDGEWRERCEKHLMGVNVPFETFTGYDASPDHGAVYIAPTDTSGQYTIEAEHTSQYLGLSRIGYVVENMMLFGNGDRTAWTFEPELFTEETPPLFNSSMQDEMYFV